MQTKADHLLSWPTATQQPRVTSCSASSDRIEPRPLCPAHPAGRLLAKRAGDNSARDGRSAPERRPGPSAAPRRRRGCGDTCGRHSFSRRGVSAPNARA
eukprot:102174-Chlamydomonas_euryale.AAC.1